MSEYEVWGPHQGVHPPDIRKCAYVTSFGPKYVHMVYPTLEIVGADDIVEWELASQMWKLAESMHEL